MAPHLHGEGINGGLVIGGYDELRSEVDDSGDRAARIAVQQDFVGCARTVAVLENPAEKCVFVRAPGQVRDRFAPRRPGQRLEQKTSVDRVR
jgi:hypothetical protein